MHECFNVMRCMGKGSTECPFSLDKDYIPLKERQLFRNNIGQIQWLFCTVQRIEKHGFNTSAILRGHFKKAWHSKGVVTS